jgi:hypothetical protein
MKRFSVDQLVRVGFLKVGFSTLVSIVQMPAVS